MVYRSTSWWWRPGRGRHAVRRGWWCMWWTRTITPPPSRGRYTRHRSLKRTTDTSPRPYSR
ncbi:hypothetical protein Hamer_G023660 [Homarus americanus]|uniref:Uncharacterized protein n=1 Tax=Homarus americanus TaxID=6706 RepID=A0A8J5MVU9_HOMAM|nr:hypothetical protein Hamer_G023660 [Homarus americanus]